MSFFKINESEHFGFPSKPKHQFTPIINLFFTLVEWP